MTTVWERVQSALAGLGVPVVANRYIAQTGGSLPDVYLVHQLISSTPAAHAENSELLRANRVQVTAWSRTGLTSVPDISSAMIAAGFMAGPRRELPYVESTRHFGLALEFVDLEDKEISNAN